MKYKVGDKVIVERYFMGGVFEVVHTISEIDDYGYFMKEDWFWYAEDEILCLEKEFIINSRFDILDIRK